MLQTAGAFLEEGASRKAHITATVAPPTMGPPAMNLSAVRPPPPTTPTILQQDGPDHLGFCSNAIPEHQMALTTSDCAPLQTRITRTTTMSLLNNRKRRRGKWKERERKGKASGKWGSGKCRDSGQTVGGHVLQRASVGDGL